MGRVRPSKEAAMTSRAIKAGGVAVILAALAAGLGVAQQAGPGAGGPEPGLKEMARQRVALARRLIEEQERTWLAPPQERPSASAAGVVRLVGTYSRRLMEAEFDLDPTPEGRAAAIGGHIARLERWAAPLTEMATTPRGSFGVSQIDLDELNLELLEARSLLLRGRGGARPDEPNRGER
jgi:hypothetical protein